MANFSQCHQSTDTGLHMHYYKETLRNLCCDVTGKTPDFFYDGIYESYGPEKVNQ